MMPGLEQTKRDGWPRRWPRRLSSVVLVAGLGLVLNAMGGSTQSGGPEPKATKSAALVKGTAVRFRMPAAEADVTLISQTYEPSATIEPNTTR